MSEPPSPEPSGLKTGKLWAMIALAAIYCGWTFAQSPPTRTDGVVGVLLGLYICSHPAANALDRLLFRHRSSWRELFERTGLFWLALNGLVVGVGWFVITLGITCLVDRPSGTS